MTENTHATDDAPLSVSTFVRQFPDLREGAVRSILFDRNKRAALEQAGAVSYMGRRLFLHPRRFFDCMRSGALR